MNEKTTEELLQEKLDKLHNNKKNCSEEDLKGKYAKAYNTLLAEIEELKLQLMMEEIFNICIPLACVKESKSLVIRLLKESNKEIHNSLYSAYSAEKCKEKCQEIREHILEVLFNQNIDWSSAERYDLLGRRLL